MNRCRNEAGVTIVEAAFALPLLLMFMMGLIDLGLWTFNANQATNAARDGARAGIIDYRQADVPHSDDWRAIVARVEGHLPGQSITEDNIDVECVRVDGGVGCDGAHPGQDTIRVEVDWSWNLLTPIAGVIGITEGEATGTATMRIIGRPGDAPPATPPVVDDSTSPTSSTTSTTSTTVPEGDCAISNVVVSRSDKSSGDPRVNGSGMLEGVDIAFTATGGGGCAGLAVQLTPAGSTQVLSAKCKTCAAESQLWTYASNDKVWSVGDASVRIFNVNVDQTSLFKVVQRQ